MNREIKFRAWDTKFGIMLNDVVVYDNNNVAMVDVAFNEAYGDRIDERYESGTEDAGPEWVCITGDLEIMQYTGLKDKNGTAIYEGDIIDPKDSDFDYCLCEWNNKYCCFQINAYGKVMYHNEGGGEEFTSSG